MTPFIFYTGLYREREDLEVLTELKVLLVYQALG